MGHDFSTLAQRLRFAMDRKKTNSNRIERETGEITRQAVGFMLDGTTTKPTWDKLVLLSSHLGIRTEWLADGEGAMLPTPQLKDEEIELIEHYRLMSKLHRQDLKGIAERWASEDDDDPGPTRHHRVPLRRQ